MAQVRPDREKTDTGGFSPSGFSGDKTASCRFVAAFRDGSFQNMATFRTVRHACHQLSGKMYQMIIRFLEK